MTDLLTRLEVIIGNSQGRWKEVDVELLQSLSQELRRLRAIERQRYSGYWAWLWWRATWRLRRRIEWRLFRLKWWMRDAIASISGGR